jgi:hypothetical protein
VAAATAATNGQGTFDLAVAAEAAAAEAALTPFAFAYKGKSYTVPPMREWPVSALRAVARGDFDSALPDLLGAEAYDELCDAGLKVGELTALFDKVAEVAGMEALPNSKQPAPPNSTRTSKPR